MLTGNVNMCPVACDTFSAGISGRTLARPTADHLLEIYSASGVGLQPRHGHGSRLVRPSLRKGDNAECQGDRGAWATAVTGTRSSLEELHDGPGGSLRR